eukprot:CAMPEP_0171268170 /NCGR_PEP_ID=MMETSP0790-20130122/59534_1 /TAXON_ID=2925 /ORGANISM="Alexandrium catenella, Strain OF101" /LENGTH=82 /DNA_ID=CAMNT_0011736925 /DNA_START=80 /DNA_END=324 /DNA_ORIENTATION=-
MSFTAASASGFIAKSWLYTRNRVAAPVNAVLHGAWVRHESKLDRTAVVSALLANGRTRATFAASTLRLKLATQANTPPITKG